MWKIKIKKVGKIFGWIGGGVIAIFFLAWAGFFVWNRFDDARIAKDVVQKLAMQEATEIEVGETPRETFSLFLDALRDNNLDLATKYFVPELREGWFAHLQSIQDKKLLDGMVTDLENIEEDAPLTEEHFRETNGQWHLVSL
ncbi:MAG: hypothetical protein Q7S16_05400 [bacterium]|nr:hypothetical protein [bacterium]